MDEGHKEIEMIIWEKMEVKQQHVTGGKHANIKEFVLMFKEKGFVFRQLCESCGTFSLAKNLSS